MRLSGGISRLERLVLRLPRLVSVAMVAKVNNLAAECAAERATIEEYEELFQSKPPQCGLQDLAQQATTEPAASSTPGADLHPASMTEAGTQPQPAPKACRVAHPFDFVPS